jgi:hypothetical protein
VKQSSFHRLLWEKASGRKSFTGYEHEKKNGDASVLTFYRNWMILSVIYLLFPTSHHYNIFVHLLREIGK